MAQLLVFDRDNHHVDPEKDRKGCYKKGDILVVAEDNHVWGNDETQYPFRVVHRDGPASNYRYLCKGEPAAMRDRYPRSMLKIKRLQIPMMKEIRAKKRRRRKYICDVDDNISIKKTGGV